MSSGEREALGCAIRRAAQKSKKALEQAYVLVRKVEEVGIRYRNARKLNMKAWRFRLKLRLVTIRNMCSAFLEYAHKQLAEYRRLTMFDAFYYETDDEDSGDESSEGEIIVSGSEREVTADNVAMATGRTGESESHGGDADKDDNHIFDTAVDAEVFPWEDEEAPHVQVIADYDVDHLFPDIFTERDIRMVVAYGQRGSRRMDMAVSL